MVFKRNIWYRWAVSCGERVCLEMGLACGVADKTTLINQLKIELQIVYLPTRSYKQLNILHIVKAKTKQNAD